MKKSRPWLDYDDCSLKFVIKDIIRLQEEFGLSKADIFESSPSYLYDCTFWDGGVVRYGSYHLKFYDVLPWKEVKKILDSSNCHEGFKHFSKTIGDITLRVSDQEGSQIPQKICTVNTKKR